MTFKSARVTKIDTPSCYIFVLFYEIARKETGDRGPARYLTTLWDAQALAAR